MVHISKGAVGLIVLFSIVETVVLTYWLMLLFPSIPSIASTAGETAAAVLLVGLLIEHVLAAVSNKV